MRWMDCRAVVAAWIVLVVPAVIPGRLWAQEEKPAPNESPESAKKAAGEPAIPKLPPEKLPARTAPPPDPAKEQYRREKVHVRIEERVEPKAKGAYSPPLRVLEEYLAEYFRRAGFEVVPAAEARYRVEGKYEARFHEAITFQGQTIAHKYRGSVRVAVREKADGPELEAVDVPEFFTDGVQAPGVEEDKLAVFEMRRRLAKVIWEKLYNAGKVFTDAEIPVLLASLSLDDPEGEAPAQAKDIMKAIVGKRLAAVPSLLDALSDERSVRVAASYPGINAGNTEKLRIYHLADKALEEIFQKVSRLDLETTAKARFAVIRGWEDEWARFCPSFRESPKAPPSRRAKPAAAPAPPRGPAAAKPAGEESGG